MKHFATIAALLFATHAYALSYELHHNDQLPIEVNDVEFAALFDAASTLTFHQVIVKDKGTIVYAIVAPFVEIRIEKLAPQQFDFTASAYVYTDTAWQQSELIRHRLVLHKEGHSFTHEPSFSCAHQLSTEEMAALLQKRKHFLSDEAYTSTDWESISKQNQEELDQLASHLLLGALQGNPSCLTHLYALRNDFDIMNAGYHSELLAAFEAVVQYRK